MTVSATDPETAETSAPSPSAASSAVVEGLFSRRYRVRSLGFAAMMFLVGFAALALVTTMPVAVRDLDGLGQYSLAFGGFVTASLFGAVLAGRAADRWGPRRPLLLGLALSVAALLLSGTAGSIWQLAGGRCLDGFAASLVMVGVNVTIGHTYPSELRPRALALMSTCWIVPSVAGPPVAGFVTEWLSWRWVFLGLAALTAVPAVAALLLRPSATPTAEGSPDGPGRVGTAGLVAIGAGLLQYAASGHHLPQLVCAAAGLALLARGVPRLLPAGTLRAARGLPAIVLLGGACSGVYFTLETFAPLMMINLRQLSVPLAGLAFTGATLTWALASWLQGHTWSSVPRHRLVGGGVALLVAACALGGLGVLPAAPGLTGAAALILAGLAMGLIVPSLTVLVLDHCRPEEQGHYTAAMQVSQGLGQVVVLGAAGALFNAGAADGHPDGPVYAAVFAVVFLIAAPALLLARRTSGLALGGQL